MEANQYIIVLILFLFISNVYFFRKSKESERQAEQIIFSAKSDAQKMIAKAQEDVNALKIQEKSHQTELEKLKEEYSQKQEVLNKESKRQAEQIISNAKSDAQKIITKAQEDVNALKIQEKSHQTELEKLKEEYSQKREIFNQLVRESAAYDELLNLAEFGHYKPHYDYDTPEHYKQHIDVVREQKKHLLQTQTAASCDISWTVNGSVREGERMTKQNMKMILRSFNNECDAIFVAVRWNNVTRMEERINKAFDTLNKLGKVNAIKITDEYRSLQVQELRLIYEHELKKQKIKEEQAEIRQRMKEEAELLREQEEAEAEEKRYQKMLDKAKREAEKATGEKLATLQQQIASLSIDLEEARAKSERAISMAQQTKAGYVYVISNIGSFGENVYKIGMTRRLDPMERVRELSGASVPFSFDVHAFIYSTDAPSLESSLHRLFDNHKVNMVNNRKEFFQINIKSIQNAILQKFPDAEFVMTAEAREYQESLMIKAEIENKRQREDVIEKFPESI